MPQSIPTVYIPSIPTVYIPSTLGNPECGDLSKGLSQFQLFTFLPPQVTRDVGIYRGWAFDKNEPDDENRRKYQITDGIKERKGSKFEP